MTVLFGSIKSSDDGWKFYGKFGPKNGPILYAIEGGLDKPIPNIYVEHAELVNAKVGPYSYQGEIGPQFLSLRSTTLPEVIVLGKLAESIDPTHVAGWFQIVQIPRE